MKKLVFLFSIVFLAASSLAVDVRPFAFTYTDSAQQNQWEALMKYKIWGTSAEGEYGLRVMGNSYITDESGYVGSAYGGLSFSNQGHALGGPLAFGGDYYGGDGNDTITSGPSHFGGDFTVSGNGNNSTVLYGYYCVEGTMTNMDNGLEKGGGTITCDEDLVPEVESYLDVPYLDTTVTYSSAISQDGSIYYIDVPPDTADEGVYDLFISSITLNNQASLYVRMPEGGRLTRIFLNGALSMTNNSNIRVMHAQDDDSEWNSTTKKWTYTDTTYLMSNADYLGNLLFYIPTDWSVAAGAKTVQGTFITTGYISIAQNMSFAGQLIAGDYVYVDNGFSAEDFKYVPFDPPIVDIDPEALAEAALQEGITDPQEVTIELDRSPSTDVNFDYCFIFEGDSAAVKSDGNTLASYADVDTSSIPICGRDTASATFSAGSTSLTEAITVTVVDDKLDENTETFTISIFELEGAIMSDGTRAGDFTLYIEDNDALLLSKDTTVTGKEDTTLVLNVFPAMKQDSSAVTTTYYIEIVTLPTVGTLTYNGTAVTVGQIIKSTNLSYLKFLGEQDSSGTPYATIVYYILNADSARSTVSYTLTINLEAVNDAPVIGDYAFSIEENSATGTTVGTIEGTDIDSETLTYAIISGNTSTAFKINSSTGVITVAGSLDYETKSSYTLKITVSDGSLKDTSTVTITIIDVNESPTIADQTLSISEDASVGTSAGTVTASDPDAGAVLTYYAISGDTDLFAIDSSTAKVTLLSATLDYETQDAHSIVVVVTDGEFYDTATITINVINVDEPISKDTTVTAYEDTVLIVNMFPAMSEDSTRLSSYSIKITSLPTVGTFLYNGSAVTVGQVISSSNLSKLTYQSEQDSSGSPYASFTYYVINSSGLYSDNEYTLTINMEPTNDYPVISDTTFTVYENSSLDSVIGTLVATDIDNDDDSLKFYINSGNSLGWFALSTSGVLTVAGEIDYESEDTITLTVYVTDGEAKYSTAYATVTIIVLDVNEAPTIANQTLYILETASVGTVAGTVVASDPENDALKYYIIGGDSSMFAIGESSGSVTLLSATLDYETTSYYTILVRVYDGEFYDTAAVAIVVEDVEETSTVRVTTVDSDDTRWVITNDTAYINRSFATISWVLTSYSGKNTYNDTLVEDLGDGCYTYTFSDDDQTINVRGSDTVTVCVSTTTPEVTITVVGTSSDSITGVTIVETGDSTQNYSNQESNTVLVVVEDPVTGAVDTITIEVTLDSVSVPSSTIKTVTSIQNSIDLDAEPDSVTKTPENGLIAVEYQVVVNGDTVTVKYYETEDGERVTTDEGDEIVYVSYTTTIDGKTVTITYAYDLTTGEVVTDETTGEVYTVSYEYTDSDGNTVTVSYSADKDGAMITSSEGDKTYEITYSYTNAYGNTAVNSVTIVLDTNGPVVKILSPENQTKVSSVSIEVVWTVDGVEQDTLTMQSLEEGVNTIIRTYRDKAGNEASDTVYVIMKNAKNVVITLVDAVTKIDAATVSEYYAGNEPDDDEVFAVSILNPNTGSEVEVLTGNSNSTSSGSGDEPYPGYTGAHLGPTLEIEVKMPSVNSVGGLATISDMIESDGLISLESGGGWDREKITVEEYISEYCSEDFQSKVDTSDLSSTPIYTVTLKAHIWTFTSLGSFVDDYSFSLDLDDETLVNEGAVLTLYFELKPGTDGLVRNTEGRALGTGAYMFKTEVKSVAILQCQLPDAEIGSKTVYKEEDLSMFGYKRPEGL